jgi:putative transposase
MRLEAVTELVDDGVAVCSAVDALAVSRATYYRHQQRAAQDDETVASARPAPARKLADQERQQVLELLDSERFVDKSPYAVFAELLDDDGVYLCSPRTMYRILAQENQVKERRAVRQHPSYSAPSLEATAPNQVWSWDITKLSGPVSWKSYHLYVIMDIYSRYVVGWMIAEHESAELAEKLIATTCERQGVEVDQLVLHSDRGPSMTSKKVAHLLSDLGVTKSLSRPRVSNDNAYSESQFKTLKYRPEFPKHFTGLLHARAFLQTFFAWYNDEHRHSGLGLMTPAMVHHGRVEEVLAQRRKVLEAAVRAHPERFVGGQAVVPAPDERVRLGLVKSSSSPADDADRNHAHGVENLTPSPEEVVQ